MTQDNNIIRIRLTEELRQAVDDTAQAESRTRNGMLRVLIQEALKKRSTREGKGK